MDGRYLYKQKVSGLDSFSGYEQVIASCTHNNEPSCYTTGREFLICRVPTSLKISGPWSVVVGVERWNMKADNWTSCGINLGRINTSDTTGHKARNIDENCLKRGKKSMFIVMGMTFQIRKLSGCVRRKKLLAKYSLEIIFFYN